MVKFTNNCATWWNSQTFSQHGEIHFIGDRFRKWKMFTNYTKTIPQQHLMTTIAQHGEIHKQLHNMMKFTNNCATWWNSQTIVQHGEIHKQLHNMLNSLHCRLPKWKTFTIHALNRIELELSWIKLNFQYYTTLWNAL